MNWYAVILAVACGAVFDTGERVEMNVQATDKLDAAIKAERYADALLEDPQVQYTHTTTVTPIAEQTAALALAA